MILARASHFQLLNMHTFYKQCFGYTVIIAAGGKWPPCPVISAGVNEFLERLWNRLTDCDQIGSAGGVDQPGALDMGLTMWHIENTRLRYNVGIMLVHRLWRCPNVLPTCVTVWCYTGISRRRLAPIESGLSKSENKTFFYRKIMYKIWWKYVSLLFENMRFRIFINSV